jgi:hypothetical protein
VPLAAAFRGEEDEAPRRLVAAPFFLRAPLRLFFAFGCAAAAAFTFRFRAGIVSTPRACTLTGKEDTVKMAQISLQGTDWTLASAEPDSQLLATFAAMGRGELALDEERVLDAMDAMSAAQYESFVDFATDARHEWHYAKAMTASVAAQAVPESTSAAAAAGSSGGDVRDRAGLDPSSAAKILGSLRSQRFTCDAFVAAYTAAVEVGGPTTEAVAREVFEIMARGASATDPPSLAAVDVSGALFSLALHGLDAPSPTDVRELCGAVLTALGADASAGALGESEFSGFLRSVLTLACAVDPDTKVRAPRLRACNGERLHPSLFPPSPPPSLTHARTTRAHRAACAPGRNRARSTATARQPSRLRWSRSGSEKSIKTKTAKSRSTSSSRGRRSTRFKM